MLNKQPLEVGQIYFSQPELLKTALQLPNQPFTIDYAQPKILGGIIYCYLRMLISQSLAS
ncbi:hypothetical protein [Latilactobacillus sakei]|uniref:hypothetical protein n=1 Tax=Latilactobacillus sakei TaxID=1599 RepID=UPI002150A640|nr:hypothetical protein [Latilactobacillus sakei]